MLKFLSSNKIWLSLIVAFLLLPSCGQAAYSRFTLGEDIVIGEFVSDDNFQPTTVPCYVSIHNPSGTLVADNILMSSRSDGWHYYKYLGADTEGVWSAIMSCGSTADGDLAKIDKTFIIGPASVSDNSIANAVWGHENRTIATTSLVSDIWNFSGRSLTSFGSLVSDIWSNTTAPNRKLTGAGLSDGGSLATQADVYQASSSIISTISGLNNISASDVWSYTNRLLTDYAPASVAAAVWASPSRSLTDFGTLVADIWNNSNRTLTDYSPSSIASVVWSNANRTLTSANLGSGGFLASEASLNSASSTIISEVLQNRALISALNNISASDIWSYSNRSLNNTVEVSTNSRQSFWDTSVSNLNSYGSIGKLLAENIDAKTSSRGTSSLTAADVWDAANRTLTDYSTSSIALAVWENGARSLTNYGNDITAADVWNVLSSSLVATSSIGKQLAENVDNPVSTRASFSGQQSGWTAVMSNVDRVLAGKTYRTKIFLTNYESTPTNAISAPKISLYDANRNLVAAGIPMNNLSAGVYEYTYSIPTEAAQGLWEAVISSEVSPGKIIETNDYWVVEGSPAQVIINGINNNKIPNISANVTITNEGLTGYEYHYEWCVVTSADNTCGGDDDVYYASASKFINSGEDWNTNLTATVPTTGNYLFKLIVHYGTEQSGSSRFFSAESGSSNNNNNTGNNGGGGGGGSAATQPETVVTSCNGADFNHDKKVNSIDLSILLVFWKTNWPFRNPCVDINGDKQANSVDFSILMYQWGTKK